jgi:hypothetical protein
MTKPTYPEALQAALESLERGDAREAFGASVGPWSIPASWATIRIAGAMR